MSSNPESLLKKRHVQYLKHFLTTLPAELSAYDSTRLTIAFFTINGLDILDVLHTLDDTRKKDIIEWVYRLQVLPEEGETKESWKPCGFQGSSMLIFPNCDPNKCSKEYACSHIAMTYTALAILLILGDDLSRVHKPAVIEGIRALQQEDGSFSCTLAGSESDMRFVYCAACVCYMLNDWSGMDIKKTIQFIKDSISYDSGIGQAPDLESHGGSTFCAVATLSLLGQLDSALSKKELKGLQRWVMARQVDGFQGRPNKPVDTCYSFWVGATLKLLGIYDFVDDTKNRNYIMSTQDSVCGGFSKWWDSAADPLHTCLGLGGLSLMGERELLAVHPALNITMRAYKRLLDIQQCWESK